MTANVATRIEKLPEAEGDESHVIEENILAPDELVSGWDMLLPSMAGARRASTVVRKSFPTIFVEPTNVRGFSNLTLGHKQ